MSLFNAHVFVCVCVCVHVCVLLQHRYNMKHNQSQSQRVILFVSQNQSTKNTRCTNLAVVRRLFYNFWCHPERCTNKCCSFVQCTRQLTCDSKICQFNVSFLWQQNIGSWKQNTNMWAEGNTLYREEQNSAHERIKTVLNLSHIITFGDDLAQLNLWCTDK